MEKRGRILAWSETLLWHNIAHLLFPTNCALGISMLERSWKPGWCACAYTCTAPPAQGYSVPEKNLFAILQLDQFHAFRDRLNFDAFLLLCSMFQNMVGKTIHKIRMWIARKWSTTQGLWKFIRKRSSTAIALLWKKRGLLSICFWDNAVLTTTIEMSFQ